MGTVVNQITNKLFKEIIALVKEIITLVKNPANKSIKTTENTPINPAKKIPIRQSSMDNLVS